MNLIKLAQPLLITLCIYSGQTTAESAPIEPSIENISTEKPSEHTSEAVAQERQYTELRQEILEREFDGLILQQKLEDQSKQMSDLMASMRLIETKASSSYTATLLTAVAVIVTALGVIIALLSIVGYRNIRNQAKKAAKDATERAIREELDRLVRTATGRAVQELFVKKNLDYLIDDAVQRVIYRATPVSELDFPEDEQS